MNANLEILMYIQKKIHDIITTLISTTKGT
jgi:hypothetical protein